MTECPCDPCQWARDAVSAPRFGKPEGWRDRRIKPISHNMAGYNRGCRCDICKTARHHRYLKLKGEA